MNSPISFFPQTRALCAILIPWAFALVFYGPPALFGQNLHEHEEHEESAGHTDHQDHDEHEEELVRLDADTLEEFDIVLAPAGRGVLHEEVVLPGEIQFNRERLAYATPRFTGTVLEIHARLADTVVQGQVLATLENTDTLRPFEVKAPFDGTIVAYEISAGQTVEAGTPLFTIANLDTVWADLRIYQRDMRKIHEGQSVLIEGRHDMGTFRGTIGYISPIVDEHTRTGLARVVIDNHNRQWKPGQFIKGSVSIEEHEADLVVPRTALVTYEGNTVVFVQTEEGFEPRAIALGHSDSESFVVNAGLSPGDVIVVKNPISLKAELGKGSFGGHHH